MIIFAQIHDRDRFISEYGIPAAKLVEKFGGEYVARAPGVSSIEGGLFEGQSAVISKWPDRDSIHRFWNSSEYEQLKEVRATLAECHVMVIEAL